MRVGAPLAIATAAAALGCVGCDYPFSGLRTCSLDADCPTGTSCATGTCKPCPACGPAEVCLQARCLPNHCATRPCPAAQGCVDGTCRDERCVDVQCPEGDLCVGGACYPSDCPTGPCPHAYVCNQEACTPATCVGITCPSGQGCANGQCHPLDCEGVTCAEGAVCTSLGCEPVDCAGLQCPAGTLCAAGDCLPVDCMGAPCLPGEVCLQGHCADARCAAATCPTGTRCQAAECIPCQSNEASCSGGEDEDCDTLVDCADPDCLAQPCGDPEPCGRFECGSAGTCAQLLESSSTVCRTAAGACDRIETCDGATAACPRDQLEAPATPCGVGSFCTGSSVDCPAPLTLDATSARNRLDTATFGGTCAPDLSLSVSGTDTATFACDAMGAWSYTTAPQTADGSRDYTFAQLGGAPLTATWIRDTSPPVLSSVQINGGAPYATTAILQVAVELTDASPPVEFRASEASLTTGDCQGQYADAGWQPWSTAAPFLITVAPLDGQKKVCAWARDALGSVSVIAPAQGTPGVDSATIEYQAGNIPVITSLTVTNPTAGPRLGTTQFLAGESVDIRWSATDVEGLANDPISIFATTDGATWTPVVQRYGALAGNPTSANGGYAGFSAPSSGFFRLKLLAWDMAGNSSVAALSETLNTPNWTVWAGSTDTGVGGSSRALGVMTDSWSAFQFDVHPLTGDLVILDVATGLLHLDAATGAVSTLIRRGTATNLPDDGPLPADATYDSHLSPRFDSDGLLYVVARDSNAALSATMYQIDLQRRWCRRYLGAGVQNDTGAAPSSVFVVRGAFAFDESHSVYFLTSCSPGTWTSGTSTMRLLKATQAGDKTAAAITRVAGNCVKGTPPRPGPADAASSPFTNSSYSHIGTIEVWNNGAAIYYSNYQEGVQKILDGQTYASNVAVSSASCLTFVPATGKLYSSQGGVGEWTPNLAGPNGDVETAYGSGAGASGDCADDGTDALAACLDVHYAVRAMPRGSPVLFVDGSDLNSPRYQRIRFKDSEGKLRTLVGTLPFHRAGLSRRLVRSDFAGIHYKQPSDPNQAAFPAGLYFIDHSAPGFGWIDPATDQTTLLWGNQRRVDLYHPSGTVISPSLPMGEAYVHDAKPLAFDAQGLPWLRYSGSLASVDGSRAIVQRQGDDGGYWESAPDGADPFLYQCNPLGLVHNLALKGAGAFFLGGYDDPGITDTLSIQWHDYAARRVTRMMGSAANVYSPDESTPGRVSGLSLSSSCWSSTECFVRYQAGEDRLYFAEPDGSGISRMRYITAPSTPASSTLATLFVIPNGQRPGDFIFSTDGRQLFYVDSSGALRCHDLGSGKAWCNDAQLGPPAGMTRVNAGPNQLTWKTPAELLVSNYKGEIYLFTLPP